LDVATDLDRPDEAPFDELERGFFAAAPPDVAEPPPEPMRFDDLDPIAPPLPEPRPLVRRARDVTSSARGALRNVRSRAGAAAQRTLPAVARATRWSAAASAAAWRISARAVTAAARVGAREARARTARLIEMARNTPRERRLLAAGIAALVFVTGLSAVVVASRGNGRPTPPAVHAVASGTGACEAPPAAPPVTVAAAEATPASFATSADATSAATDESIAPQAAPPPRKRKQSKSPARHTVRVKPSGAKPSGTIPTAAANRPMFSR